MNTIFARINRAQIHKKKYVAHTAFSTFAVLFVIGSIFSYNSSFVYAATYNFVQSSWSGGTDGGVIATHASNQSNWTKYSAQTGLTVGTDVRIPSTAYTFTDDGATSTSPSATTLGGGFSNGTNSSSAITGSGTSASVTLAGTATPLDMRADYAVGTTPNSTVFDPSTNSIWTSNNGANTVTKTNASTGAVAGTYSVGSHPTGIAFDSFTNSIWVVNNAVNTVSKLSASTGATIGTYAVGSNSQWITFDSINNTVWISSYGANNVTALNASDGSSFGTYAVGGYVEGIVFDSYTNSIWVGSANTGLKKINPTTGVISSFSLCGGTGNIAFDSSTNSIWVPCYGYYNNVTKVNVSTGAVVGTYNLSSPSASVFDASTNSIWVTNQASSTVSKLSASTGALIATYSVGTTPIGVTFDSATNSIWVANSGSNTVSKLSASSGSSISTYSVGTNPQGVAFDSLTNSIWTANYTTNTVTKTNASTGTTIGTYSVGTYPIAVTFDSSTNSIWVANNNSDNVTKLDASTGALINTYAVGSRPFDIVFDPYTNSIWTANYVASNVTKLSASTGALLGTYATAGGAFGIGFNPVSNTIWVTNINGLINKLNPTTGAVLNSYNTGSGYPYKVTFDSFTNSMWVSDNNLYHHSVYKLNAATDALIGVYYPTSAGATLDGISFDSGTNSIWVADNTDNTLIKLNASTGAIVGSYVTGTGPNGVIFDSSTNSIWVANSGSNTIMKIKTASVAYPTSGTFTSAAINLGAAATFGNLSWASTLNGGTVTMKARSSATADFSGATAWASCTNITSGAALSTGGCVTNGQQYIQYQATLSTSDTTKTPTLDSVSIGYTQYGSGTLTSSIYDSGDPTNLVTNMKWTATGTTSTEVIKFQVRSAATSGGIATAAWCGPADTSVPCSGTSYFTDPAGGIILPTNNPLRSGGDDRYFQYQAYLSSGGSATPVLTQATVQYVVNAAPNFDATYGTNGVAVSQNSATSTNPGAVSISYKVRDIDTSTGTVNPGFITPSFEYNSGAGWVAIPAGNLAAGDTSNKAVDGSIYNTYTATWFATSTLANAYNASVAIRVTANDNEGANNTAQAASASFALDTKPPVATAFFDGTANLITLSATDNSQLQYRFCNNAAFPATDTQGNSCAWSTLGGTIASSTIAWTPFTDAQGNKPVYLQTADYYGNTAASTIVAPATPSNFDLKDVSNTSINVYKEFLSWGIFTATSSVSFGSYKLYTSTDGTTYVPLTTITDSAVNYYVDTITTATTSTHYYKLTAVTSQGNTSAYTATLSDVPNGQGGTDTTPPVIDPASVVVPSATLKNTSAAVTFSTDELSKGTVQYKKQGNSGWFTVTSPSYSLAHSVYIQGLSANTAYSVQVQATDVVGNVSAYVPGPSFTTPGGPVITDVSAINLTDNSVSVVWNTSTSSDSYIYYSTNQDLSGSAVHGSATPVACIGTVCQHSVNLTGLAPSTTYYYYVQSTDSTSNTTVENNTGSYYSFHTTLDVVPPVVSNISTPVISSNAAVIVWQTDKPATSQVIWGTTSGNLTRTTVADLTKTIQHIVSLSPTTNDMSGAPQDLTPLTPYYFSVVSVGTNGITGSSTEQTFTSLKTGDVVVVGGTATNSSIQTGAGTAADTTPPTITTVSANNMGAFSADVKVETDKDVVAFVKYGTDTTYGSTEGDSTLSSSKIVTLSRLTEGTEYHYQVTVIDKSGNTTSSADQTFKTGFVSELLDNRSLLQKASDVQGKIQQLIESALPSLAPPFITAPTIANITENSADISWTTNIKTNGSVRYATDADYLAKNDYVTEVSTGQDTTTDTSHAVTLTGLTPNTLYHVQVRSYVFPQVVGKSTDLTFSTKASPISPNIVAVKNDGFTVVWQTDTPTTSIVEYTNLKNGEINRIVDNTMQTYHNVQIQNLPSGTSYTVLASGVNKNGNQLSADQSLSVTTTVDITPPVISNFKVDNALVPGRVGFIQTVVGWQTDKPANSTVYYEEGAGATAPGKELANKVESLDSYTTSHIMILANLKAGTVYRIKVVSMDQSGNTKSFGPTSIITPQQSQSVLDIIVKNFEDTFKFLGAKQ